MPACINLGTGMQLWHIIHRNGACRYEFNMNIGGGIVLVCTGARTISSLDGTWWFWDSKCHPLGPTSVPNGQTYKVWGDLDGWIFKDQAQVERHLHVAFKIVDESILIDAEACWPFGDLDISLGTSATPVTGPWGVVPCGSMTGSKGSPDGREARRTRRRHRHVHGFICGSSQSSFTSDPCPPRISLKPWPNSR